MCSCVGDIVRKINRAYLFLHDDKKFHIRIDKAFGPYLLCACPLEDMASTKERSIDQGNNNTPTFLEENMYPVCDAGHRELHSSTAYSRCSYK